MTLILADDLFVNAIVNWQSTYEIWKLHTIQNLGKNIIYIILYESTCILISYSVFRLFHTLFFRNQATKHELCPKPDHSLARRFSANEKLDSCCGNSVYKFPFASAGGKRACCGTRTYDTDIMQCCDQDWFYLLMKAWYRTKTIVII